MKKNKKDYSMIRLYLFIAWVVISIINAVHVDVTYPQKGVPTLFIRHPSTIVHFFGGLIFSVYAWETYQNKKNIFGYGRL